MKTTTNLKAQLDSLKISEPLSIKVYSCSPGTIRDKLLNLHTTIYSVQADPVSLCFADIMFFSRPAISKKTVSH